MILVTGATGTVGSAVAQELLAAGHGPRMITATSRSPDSMATRMPHAVAHNPPRHLVFGDASTYREAFQGVEAMFLVRPPHISNAERDINPAIDAAIAAGVRHIAFLSLIGVTEHPRTPHFRIEEHLGRCGVTTTSLRASFFAQNLTAVHRDEIRVRDEIVLPVGDAPTAFVDARDVGAVAAMALAAPATRSAAHDLTGPQALTYHDVVELLSTELGRPIRYRSVGDISFFLRKLRDGTPMMFALVMTLLYRATRNGSAAEVSDAIPTLLGRPANSLASFVREFRSSWITSP